MLINSLIGKQVLVKLSDGAIKGTLKAVGNYFILVDEKYINIAHIIKMVKSVGIISMQTFIVKKKMEQSFIMELSLILILLKNNKNVRKN